MCVFILVAHYLTHWLKYVLYVFSNLFRHQKQMLKLAPKSATEQKTANYARTNAFDRFLEAYTLKTGSMMTFTMFAPKRMRQKMGDLTPVGWSLIEENMA